MSTDIRAMTLVCISCFRPFNIVVTFGDHPPKMCAHCRYLDSRDMMHEADEEPDDAA
jgi:hypothetical protein